MLSDAKREQLFYIEDSVIVFWNQYGHSAESSCFPCFCSTWQLFRSGASVACRAVGCGKTRFGPGKNDRHSLVQSLNATGCIDGSGAEISVKGKRPGC